MLFIRLYVVPCEPSFSSSSPNVHLFHFDQLCLLPQLVSNQQHHEDRQQYVIDNKILSAKWIQESCVSLEEDEEDVCSESEICAVRIPHCFEGERVNGLILSGKTLAEANMYCCNSSPGCVKRID